MKTVEDVHMICSCHRKGHSFPIPQAVEIRDKALEDAAALMQKHCVFDRCNLRCGECRRAQEIRALKSKPEAGA
jgi:hypothetical protein